MGLSPEQIQGLLAKKRVKGLYEEKLTFLYSDSDEAGVDVAETWPEFAGKPATTLYQGFSNAAKKLNLEDAVDVINRDGHVFILVTTRATLVVAELAKEDTTSTNGSKPADADNSEDTTELV
jgi:hypothetical protein